MKVTINNNIISLDINTLSTIYKLKSIIHKKFNIPVNKQTAYYNGIKLKNNITFYEYGIKNHDTIEISSPLKGGDKYKILFIIGYIICFLLYFLLMSSGFISITAEFLGFSIQKGIFIILDYIQYGLNYIIGDISKFIFYPIKILLLFVNFIIKHSIIFLFIYGTTALIMFPIILTRGHQRCPSISVSRFIGLTIAAIFMIIYLIFQINNIMKNVFVSIFKEAGFVGNAVSSVAETTSNYYDYIKYVPTYTLLFPIAPFLIQYHQMLEFINETIATSLTATKVFGCTSETTMCIMSKYFKKILRIPSIEKILKNYHILELIKLAAISFDYKSGNTANNSKLIKEMKTTFNLTEFEINNAIKEKVNEPFTIISEILRNKLNKNSNKNKLNKLENALKKDDSACENKFQKVIQDFNNSNILVKLDIFGILSKTAYNYYGGWFIRYVLCGAIDVGKNLNDYYEYMGTAHEVTDMIKTSNIAGTISSISLLIIIILSFFLNSMFGIKFQ